MTLVKITVIQILCLWFLSTRRCCHQPAQGPLRKVPKTYQVEQEIKFFFLAVFWGDATREINKTRRKLSVSNPIHLNANSSTSMWCTWKSRGHTDHKVKLTFVATVAELKSKASNTLNLNILKYTWCTFCIQVHTSFLVFFLAYESLIFVLS